MDQFFAEFAKTTNLAAVSEAQWLDMRWSYSAGAYAIALFAEVMAQQGEDWEERLLAMCQEIRADHERVYERLRMAGRGRLDG